MKSSKILINIKNKEEIEEYKKIGITNFLFALEGFSIDEKCFTLEELKSLDINIYLNINRIMDTEAINEFKKIVPELQFVKGIFFEDLGIYNILKDSNLSLIWNQAHFVLNSTSINSWLSRVHSACLANDLTKEEIVSIINNANKPVVLNVFGLNIAMYSRRYLLSMFKDYYHLNSSQNAILKVDEQNAFIAQESKYGTVLYYDKYFNYLGKIADINDDKILFYYINPFNLKPDIIKEIIKGQEFESEEKFLNNKTIYKIGD